MNWAYLHLAINHFPIIGMFIGTFLLLAGIIFHNLDVKISGLGTILFAGIMSVFAYLTGNPAEEAVKVIPDVAKSLVTRHEYIASVGMYLLIPSVVIAALALYSIWKKEKSARLLIISTFMLSLISTAAMIYVGRTGGEIRHNEFRSEATKQYMIEHQNDIEDDD